VELTFVHGAGMAVSAYRPAWAPLAGRVRVHALNARGHGGSGIPGHMDYAEARADLRRYVLERMRPPVILGGHSFGALISMALAAESPEIVSGLLLLDPLVPWRRGEAWKPAGEGPDRELIEATRTRRAEWPSRAEAAAWLRARGSYRHWNAEAFSGFCEMALTNRPGGSVALACPPAIEVETYLGRPGPEIFEWAERAQAPAVIVRGRDSSHCPQAGAEDLANAYALGTVLQVKGWHTFPMEHPEETSRVLRLALTILAGGPEEHAVPVSTPAPDPSP
jgi:pimeloyl-ACP methyl ester carboxylesterase